MKTNNQLVTAWIKYHHDKDEELIWAWEELDRLTHKDPTKAWNTILEIMESDSSDHILPNLSAGPLEDLLVYHGEQFIDQIELTARQNPKFTKLIMGVWENNMTKEVWARFSALQKKYENIV